MSAADVLIVGGGLAGLACGRELARRGITFQILEGSDGVGGRVRTDLIDGFRLDRGFQIYLTAYPEGARVLDLAALDLKPFTRGALVRVNGKFHRVADPRSEPLSAVASLFNAVGTPVDKVKLVRLLRDVWREPPDAPGPDRSTLDQLRAAGLGSKFVDRLFRPFFGGVFLERELSTSARLFRFVFGAFAAGPGAVPALGMQAIPDQLAAGLPAGAVRLNAKAETLIDNAVTLVGGETLHAKAVVVATDGTAAARLLGGAVPAPAWKGNATLYYAAAEPPVAEPILLLDGDGRGPVNHAVAMSNASPAYAPPGQALVAASVVGIPSEGNEELDRRARVQLTEWFGAAVAGWKLLRVYRIPEALPVQAPGALDPWQRPVQVRAGLYMCGDHRDNASIDGALTSGRRAAEAVAADLAR